MPKITKETKIVLDAPVSSLPGVGPKKAEALNKAGCQVVFDILRFYPTKYQDRRKSTPVSSVEFGKTYLLRVKLESIKSYFARRGLTVINAIFSDNSGKITAKWFNRTYLTKQLLPNVEYWVFGAILKSGNQFIVSNPEVEKIEELNGQRADVLTAIYPSNARLSEARISPLALRKLISSILDNIDCFFFNESPKELPPGKSEVLLFPSVRSRRPCAGCLHPGAGAPVPAEHRTAGLGNRIYAHAAHPEFGRNRTLPAVPVRHGAPRDRHLRHQRPAGRAPLPRGLAKVQNITNQAFKKWRHHRIRSLGAGI